MTFTRSRFLASLAALAATPFSSGTRAQAAPYPRKSVSVIVPYSAGGPADAMARQLQPALQKALGGTVIVENVGGAGGSLGVNRVLAPPTDGHAVLLASPMDLVLAPLTMSAARYQPEDMQLVGMIISTDLILLARKGLPASNVSELIALAKRGKLSYGSVGQGSLFHLAAEQFSKRAGIEMIHVPYKGGGPLVQDLMGGQIDLAFFPLAGPTLGAIQADRIKALALASTTRHPLLPQLPLVSETPGFGEFSYDIWGALGVARSTPPDVSAKLHAALVETLGQPEIRKLLESAGPRVPRPAPPDEVDRLYRQEIQRYRQLAQQAGIKPE